MTKPDLSGRTPTVQRVPAFSWPRWTLTPRRPARPLARDPRTQPQTAAPPVETTATPRMPSPAPRKSAPPASSDARPAGSLPGWLLRESIALLGMAGAAVTVFSQLAAMIPISRPFMDILGWWMTVSSNFWLTHYDDLGFYPHSHLQAAIALAAFLTMIGLGARISAMWSGERLQRRWPFLEGMTWPSLAIMASLAMIFLLAHDPTPSETTFESAASRELIKYMFAVILMVGYALGDHLGQRGFHIRLYRLAFLVLLLVALNSWLLPSY